IVEGNTVLHSLVSVPDTFEEVAKKIFGHLPKCGRDHHHHFYCQCFIDGPYGTETREVFDTEHAVLIGASIGVTPSPRICKVSGTEKVEMDMHLKKLDFVWVNSDQKSFEWFLTLLNKLEIEQSDHRGPLKNSIQMHMYMTAAQKKTDMKGIGLQ
ncbi:hypothetical protein DPMN_141565, partial [Dreissena polymorpha]